MRGAGGREMAGLAMAVVPRSLGLVAALAVSGTALYLVYGYNKKKAFVSSGTSWRLEYVHGGSSAMQQKQQQHQSVSGKESGVCLTLREGEEIGIRELQWHQLPWLRKAIRRLPQPPALLLLSPARGAELLTSGSLDREDESLEDRLDAAQVNAFRDALSSFRAEERQQLVDEHHPADFSTVMMSSAAGRLENLDNRSAESYDCKIQETPVTDSWTVPASAASCDEHKSSSRVLVGCFVIPGSRKLAGKPKKVVRFSPCVAEPSSNNKDYRSRFKTLIAQRAALQVHQGTHMPSSNAAVRSIAYDNRHDRPRAPSRTLTYSVYRYRGRSHY